MVEDEIKLLKVPAELSEFIGDYYKAMVKRAVTVFENVKLYLKGTPQNVM